MEKAGKRKRTDGPNRLRPEFQGLPLLSLSLSLSTAIDDDARGNFTMCRLPSSNSQMNSWFRDCNSRGLRIHVESATWHTLIGLSRSPLLLLIPSSSSPSSIAEIPSNYRCPSVFFHRHRCCLEVKVEVRGRKEGRKEGRPLRARPFILSR